jgi:hypothetical protein
MYTLLSSLTLVGFRAIQDMIYPVTLGDIEIETETTTTKDKNNK